MKIGIVKLLDKSSKRTVFDVVNKACLRYPEDWLYKPVCLEVEITNTCNLGCRGCGLKDESSKLEKVLSEEDFIRIFNTAEVPLFWWIT